jgi:hypothetical protein
MCALGNPLPDVGRNLDLFLGYDIQLKKAIDLALFSELQVEPFFFHLPVIFVVIYNFVGGQICSKERLTMKTLRTLSIYIYLYLIIKYVRFPWSTTFSRLICPPTKIHITHLVTAKKHFGQGLPASRSGS